MKVLFQLAIITALLTSAVAAAAQGLTEAQARAVIAPWYSLFNQPIQGDMKALQEQVEGTAALVRNAEAQTKATVARLELEQSKWERLLTKEKSSIQPIFVFQGGQGGGGSFRMQFKNEGGRARSLTVRSLAPPQGRVEIQPSDYIGEDGNGTIGVDGMTTFPTKLEIGYLDAEGNEGIMRLEIYSAGAFRLG